MSLSHNSLDRFESLPNGTSQSQSLMELTSAARAENWRAVARLVSRGADMGERDEDGRTALIYAAIDGRYDIINLLVEHGADVNVQDLAGRTALMEAAGNGRFVADNRHVIAVQVLIDNGAAVNAASLSGVTPLMRAATAGRFDILVCLEDHGTEWHAKTIYGLSALTYGVIGGGGYVTVTRYLIDQGLDVDTTCEGGKTLLMEAATERHLDLVEVLISRGADANACDNTGRTALMIAADKGERGIVECLLNIGADINATDSMGQTALSRAAFYGEEGVVHCLVERGVDFRISSKAFMMARYRGYDEIFEYLCNNLDPGDAEFVGLIDSAADNSS